MSSICKSVCFVDCIQRKWVSFADIAQQWKYGPALIKSHLWESIYSMQRPRFGWHWCISVCNCAGWMTCNLFVLTFILNFVLVHVVHCVKFHVLSYSGMCVRERGRERESSLLKYLVTVVLQEYWHFTLKKNCMTVLLLLFKPLWINLQ